MKQVCVKNAWGYTEIFPNVLQSMPAELKCMFQPASPCARAYGCTLCLIGIHAYIELV